MANQITYFNQFKSILWLKLLQARRDRKFLFIGLLVPLIGIALSIVFNTITLENNVDNIPEYITSVSNTPLTLNPSLNGEEDTIISTMSSMFNVSFQSLPEQTMTSLILNDTLVYQQGGYSFQNYSINTTENNYSYTIFFNQSSIIPSLNRNFFISLYKLLTNNTLTINENLNPLPSGTKPFELFPFIGPILIQYSFIFFVPYFAILVVVDREKGIRNHLYLNSLRTKAYWTGYLVGDYILYLVPAIIGWSALAIARIDGFYNQPASFFLFICFGISAIPFGYVIQFLFDKEETASKWLYPMASIISSMPSLIISFAAKNGAPTPVNLILSLLPAYSLYDGLANLVRGQGNIITTIIVQIVSGFIYLILVYVIERIRQKPSSKRLIQDVEIHRRDVDPDVVDEKDRVVANLGNDSSRRDIISVNGIFKHFVEDMEDDKSGMKKQRIKPAVDGVWFGVAPGECFGLLGHNGAGKTTLVNIMSGILDCDHGDGFIDGYSISHQRDKAFNSVGSCPQFDCLFDNLNIREHLYLFSKIKGVSEDDMNTQIQYFIDKFDIAEHTNKKSKELSGGTKRKLSVACSLIGSPRVVFLDEASSGVDPSSRRQLWDIIQEMKPGKAIILISHSMDEVDYLANRIAIMANGRLKCIGTPIHLKHKYGAGYTLDIQPSDISKIPDIQSFIRTKFPEAVFMEKLGGMLSYEIPTNQISLGRLFRECEIGKKELGILDFSVSQTSLEKVFLKFALEQASNEDKDNTIEIPKKKFGCF